MADYKKVGDGKYRCGKCRKIMFYDGRCGDGPVCLNEECREEYSDPDDYWRYGPGSSR